MVNKNKLLLQEAIDLLSIRPLSQDNIDCSVLKLKEVKQLYAYTNDIKRK